MPLPTRRAARADLPTAWGGEIGADSPPGALRPPTSPLRGEAKLAPTPHPARCARRPPHCVGSRNWRRFPTRRAARADLPTAWGGEIAYPPGADLPAWRGGEIAYPPRRRPPP